MSALTVLSCEGCGKCCEGQGMPPGYQLLLRSELSDDLPEDDEDLMRWREIPLEAFDAILAYDRRVIRGEVRDPGPCCWLDPDTRRCRWYEHRPQICRDYELGGAACLAERDLYDIREREARP